MLKVPFPRKPEESATFLLEGLADHRAAYFALSSLTQTFSFRRLPQMGPALDVLEKLDPLETDWTQPLLLTDTGQVEAVKKAIKKMADLEDGSWFSQQAGFMLDERAQRPHEVALPAQGLGEVAIQGALF